MRIPTSLARRVLQVTDLACQRGDRLIFNDIRFELRPGEVLTLRGPNGAGKTSLLMCLAGYLHPLAGKVTIKERGPNDRPGADMHYIGHLPALKSGLTVSENLIFWARVNGGDADLVPMALDEAGIGHAAEFDSALLSAGQIRRLALSRLLVAPRPIWLLDEPTAALDQDGDKLIGQWIDRHRQNGGIAVIATHLDLQIPQGPHLKTLSIDPIVAMGDL